MSFETKKVFTGTGVSDSVYMAKGLAKISGTFVGTVGIEVDVLGDGVFAPVVDMTGAAVALTAPGAIKIDNGVGAFVRLSCTAFTSGTITGGLRGQ
ncbi:hypothetical protein [Phyllobacterium chamaecytisi]|uniref:hypothetical protein n=1 Tax=Phyllobacterium chamaecytisi TaxID=2876082 RepID=UPI001CCAC220|nr:hypothetical protein [Phyllobacterium sp. KW56]MBZ9600741.1 hypothetical protein [Phyllobacterium sp. KW56]